MWIGFDSREYPSRHVCQLWEYKVFENTIERDVVACQQIDHSMSTTGMKPDKVIYMGILNVCASLPSLDLDKEIHSSINRAGYSFRV